MDLFKHLLKHLPEGEVSSLKNSFLENPSNSLFLNTKVISSDEFTQKFPLVVPHPFLKNVFSYPNEYGLGKNLLHDLGAYYIQDASATLVPHFLDPQPGERILDMCASPGGKTIRTALLMNNSGLIVANDNSFSRVLNLNQNVERFGLINVIITTNDMTYFAHDYENYFDKVILDAPCSGSGMGRKEPKMLNDWSENKVLKLAKIQRTLLSNAIRYVKDNGIIAYSTCSFSYEENEDIVLSALKTGDVELIPIQPFSGSFHHPDLPGSLRLHPNRYSGEGQFVAILRKVSTKGIKPRIKKDNAIKYKIPFITSFDLMDIPYFLAQKNVYFAVSFEDDLKYLQIFKKGLELGIKEEYGFVFHHGLSHYLDSSESVPLTRDEMKKYIKGEELELSVDDGWHLVKYEQFNLGFVRVKTRRAKNFYPKGLRKTKVIF